MNEAKNIYQRINAVMKEVKYIQKDAKVQGYMAVTHDKVTATLRESLVNNGIIIVLKQESGEILEKRDKANGVNMHLYSGSYVINFVNMDNPEDLIQVRIEAHAADNGDKAPGKAASYATKHAMLKLFSLETGENDESREAEPISHSELQKDQFDDFIATGNALGMTVFSQTVGDDVMVSLNNSFKKGEKSSGKASFKDLSAEGFRIIKATAQEISDMIAKEDPAVTEITSELGDVEKRLVAKHLNSYELQYLRSMTI
jgi:hypothetical protein